MVVPSNFVSVTFSMFATSVVDAAGAGAGTAGSGVGVGIGGVGPGVGVVVVLGPQEVNSKVATTTRLTTNQSARLIVSSSITTLRIQVRPEVNRKHSIQKPVCQSRYFPGVTKSP